MPCPAKSCIIIRVKQTLNTANILHKNSVNSQLFFLLSLLGSERLVSAETSHSLPNKERRKNSWLLTVFLCKILIAYANGDEKRQNLNTLSYIKCRYSSVASSLCPTVEFLILGSSSAYKCLDHLYTTAN
jgi:hypothetical protein